MTRIAFLGLGAMGARMAHRLLDAGHQLRVWNRSPQRADALVAAGAVRADSPREAVQGVELAISMVRDDDASRAVWLDPQLGALQGLSPGSLALECSTLSVGWVRELAAGLGDRGVGFLDAPLAGSRPQAEAGQLIFLVGGESDHLERARPVLEVLGGAIHPVGENGAGATVKLMVNALFGTQLALLGELLGFAERQGVDPGRAVKALGATPVCSPAAKLAAGAMLAGQWAPAFPVELVAKDFGLLAASAGAVGASVPVGEATGEVYRAAERAGYGGDNITGVVRLYR